jgi:outer membrane biosynthesis protein TonB
MLRSRGRHHPLGFASVVAVLTLGAFASPTYAEAMVSSHDGTVDAVVSAADQTRPAPKKPPPSPSPTPSPTPDPTPTPEPTPTPSPAPTPTPTPAPAPTSAPPNPTPEVQPKTPDPAVTASTGLFGPTSPGESVTGGDTRSDPGDGPDPERAQGGEGSWIESVASILTQLASIENAPETAESASPCRGSDCGSASQAIGPKVLVIALILIGLAVVGSFAIRARRRSSGGPA